MNSVPLTYHPSAESELRAIRGILRPAVLEQLSRIAANYRTCSVEAKFPRPPGRESGLWCRHPNGHATLVEILFRAESDADEEFLIEGDTSGPEVVRLVVRRILMSQLHRLPPWVTDLTGWGNATPWPLVDL